MARMANNCSARAPRSSHRHGSANAIFAPSAHVQCGWQRGAKMTVKSCGSHFVTIFTLCSREACRRCRAALQHLEHSVCAPYMRWSVQIAPTDQRHWSVGAIPTDQSSLVGRDRPALHPPACVRCTARGAKYWRKIKKAAKSLLATARKVPSTYSELHT